MDVSSCWGMTYCPFILLKKQAAVKWQTRMDLPGKVC